MRALVLSILLALALTNHSLSGTLGHANSDAPVHPAPGPYATHGAIVPRGTAVEIGACFDEGAYCYVEASDIAGYVEGKRLDVPEGRVDQVEGARWAEIRASTDGQPQTIVAWGDSMTAGALQQTHETYPAQAEALFGFARAVSNQGVGGQNSTAIAARMNALPTLLSFDGDAIPAQGKVTVVHRNTTPVTNQGPRSLTGTVCGVHGVLSADTRDGGKSYSYSFAQDRAATDTPCPAGSLFVFDAGMSASKSAAWIWAGTNGADPGHSVASDVAAMVATVGNDHYLVGAILSGAEHSTARIANAKAINAVLARTYGKHFVDLAALLAEGSDGSAGDAADIAAGVTPRSLRVDALHLNAQGNAIVAKAFHDATLQLGF